MVIPEIIGLPAVILFPPVRPHNGILPASHYALICGGGWIWSGTRYFASGTVWTLTPGAPGDCWALSLTSFAMFA